jgi:hypothetical protein
VLACLIGAFAVGSVQAATVNPVQPTAGSSTATVDVSVQVPDLFWIQNLDGIPLGYNLGSDATGEDEFCIFASTAAYDLTISSLTPTGTTTFVATGSGVPTVDYTVKFDTSLDASLAPDVTEGVLIDGIASSNTAVPADCSADNVSIFVRFAEAGNLISAPADVYSDTLTLLVEPD